MQFVFSHAGNRQQFRFSPGIADADFPKSCVGKHRIRRNSQAFGKFHPKQAETLEHSLLLRGEGSGSRSPKRTPGVGNGNRFLNPEGMGFRCFFQADGTVAAVIGNLLFSEITQLEVA